MPYRVLWLLRAALTLTTLAAGLWAFVRLAAALTGAFQ